MTTEGRKVLPELPKLDWSILRDDRVGEGGFLWLRRLALTVSGVPPHPPFTYDVVERRALDACVIVAHERRNHAPWVWLRSCIRPPVALRPSALAPTHGGVLWEVPAGLVEPREAPEAAARRELEEELGFTADARAVRPLGSWTVPAPGFVGEVHHFFHVPVDGLVRRDPSGDGSPLEAGARLVCVSLERALAACRSGEIRDAKTELALRRLADDDHDAG